jgi:hypothetical protein
VNDMTRYMYAAIVLGLFSVGIPLRAANRPHAITGAQSKVLWTNEDLDKLHDLGMISIVGRENDENPNPAPVPAQYQRTQDPEWYAEQAAKLRGELENRQAQLRDYQQALDDARSLSESTGGLNLVDEDSAMTPEAGIEILQQRVSEAQSELDALEDLARRNDIEPGALRGQ